MGTAKSTSDNTKGPFLLYAGVSWIAALVIAVAVALSAAGSQVIPTQAVPTIAWVMGSAAGVVLLTLLCVFNYFIR
jgi:cytosine/uracil/thiamine/allantoin permease